MTSLGHLYVIYKSTAVQYNNKNFSHIPTCLETQAQILHYAPLEKMGNFSL